MMFDSAVRLAGDLAGVFEYDGETGYFYLYEIGGVAGHRVLDSIHIFSGAPDFSEEDVAIEWDSTNRRVGLFIRKALWAAFDEHRAQYGGNYKPDAAPQVPSHARLWFGLDS